MQYSIPGRPNKAELYLYKNRDTIESWFHKNQQPEFLPIYSSLDCRDAGFKLASIDTNLFPAGFQHLHQKSLPYCHKLIKQFILQQYPNTKSIVLLAENHTRNHPYHQSIAALVQIIRDAGFICEIGVISPELKQPQIYPLASSQGKLSKITVYPLQFTNNQLQTPDFVPDLIILNNDFSNAVPKFFSELTQPVLPSHLLSWEKRYKSNHYKLHSLLGKQLAETISLDPFLISTEFADCGEVNFMTKQGWECIKHHTDIILTTMHRQYHSHGVDKKPFVAIKSDQGTYGMAVLMVSDVHEIDNINRRQRSHMAKRKDMQVVDRVIIQEGIPTAQTLTSNIPAETVIYNIGLQAVGAFMRGNPKKTDQQNLNKPGAIYKTLVPYLEKDSKVLQRFYAYSVINRLAVLASSQEIQQAQQMDKT